MMKHLIVALLLCTASISHAAKANSSKKQSCSAALTAEQKQELANGAAKDMIHKFYVNFHRQEIRDVAGEIDGLTQKLLKNTLLEKDFVDEKLEDEIRKSRQAIINAYIAHVSQAGAPQHEKGRGTVSAPTLDDLLVRLQEKAPVKYANLTVDDLSYIIGENNVIKPKAWFPPLFDGGLKEVKEIAAQESPNKFANYRDEEFYPEGYSEETLQKIKDARGMLVTTAVAHMPIRKAQLDAMIRYAEERDFVIIVYPANGQLFGLDEALLNHPRVRVLVDTIDLGETLRLWNIPIMPKNQNPFASLNQRGQGERGQTQIVGTVQQAMMTVPTKDNDDYPHNLWSPGAITENIFPYATDAAGRTAMLAKGYYHKGFLVVEKADVNSNALFSGRGASDQWHIRNVEYFDERDINGEIDPSKPYGFIDVGFHVTPDKIQKIGPTVLKLGDLHDWVADQDFVAAIKRTLQEYPTIKKIILHDVLDGFTFNHHEAKDLMLLMKKLRNGELSINKEVNGVVQTLNAILNLRQDLEIELVYSNHPAWLEKLINDKNAISDPMNAKIIGEIRDALANDNGLSVMEYLFGGGRERVADALSSDRGLYENFMEGKTLLLDPGRIDTQDPGSRRSTGPRHRLTQNDEHGDAGDNGARGSKIAHSKGADGNSSGDNHQAMIWGRYISLGNATGRQRYARRGYSSWSEAFEFDYEEFGEGSGILLGVRQLMIWNNLAHAYAQDPEADVLPANQFFNREPRVDRSDNVLYPELREFMPDTADVFSAGAKATARKKKNSGN